MHDSLRSARRSLAALSLSLVLVATCLAQSGRQSVDQLLDAAKAAQEAGKLFDPAEGNAFELFLEVTEHPDAAFDPRVRRLTDSMAGTGPLQQAQYALNEMFPSGLTRVEQALRDGELVDAGRILGMLEKVQSNSPTVQRYRTNHTNALAAARAGLRSTDPETLPALLSSRPPTYPPRALRQSTEGWVFLRFTIQPDGSVNDLKVLAAEPLGVFERDATRALSQWRFEATGRTYRAQQRFDFNID